MRLDWLLGGALVLLAGLLVGCPKQTAPVPAPVGPQGAGAGFGGEPTEKRIIVLTNGNSPFWDACRAGLQDAQKDLGLEEAGITAVLEVNDGTVQGQLDKLRQFSSQSDIVGVGVSAIVAKNVAVADEMRALQKKGVKVITIDSDLDRETLRDARFAFVGTDNLAGGRELGKCAAGLRPDGGQYVTFVGMTGAQNAVERVKGFGEGAGEKFTSIDNMGDELDRTRARDNVRNAIRNHPEVNVLVGIWSYNAPAIADVVTELDKRSIVTVVAFDAEPVAIQQMGQGKIDAMVVQNPYQMGYQGVRLLKALSEEDEATINEMLPNLGKADGDLYDTGLKVVVPDEGSPLSADWFQENTEFLNLGEFRQWLDRYGLSGS